MADGNVRSQDVRDRDIRLTDFMFGADRTVPNLADAARADTLAEIIQTIFENPPSSLTDAELVVLRTLLDVVNTAGVEAEAVAAALARFSNDEKTKLADLAVSYDLGTGTQAGSTFTFAAPTGFTAFPVGGQFVYFDIGEVSNPDDTDVIVQIGTTNYDLTSFGERSVKLHELIDDTQYLALGKDAALTLMGPADASGQIVDITDSSLPAPDADAIGRLYLNRRTPAAYIIHETPVATTPAGGNFPVYTGNSDYLGYGGADSDFPLTASSSDEDSFYWNTTDNQFREWRRILVSRFPDVYEYHYRTVHNPGVFLGGTNGEWLGYSGGVATLRQRLPQDGIEATHRYIGVTTNATGAHVPQIRELDNDSYTAAVNFAPIYDFVTVGLYGQGGGGGLTAAQVQALIDAAINALIDSAPSDRNTLNELNDAIEALLDTTRAGFPIIPIEKGGTAADNATDARTNLGLGTAATRDVGNTAGQVVVIGAFGTIADGVISSDITRDTEIQDSFIGGSIASNVITLTRRSGVNALELTVTGGGSGGVVETATLDATTQVLTITQSGGGDVTVDLSPIAGLTMDEVDARVRALVETYGIVGETDRVPYERLPTDIATDADITTAINAALTDAVIGNTETGITVTFDTNGKLNFIVDGLPVHTTAAFTGDGTTANPLGLANNAVSEGNLNMGNAPTDAYVVGWDAANSRLLWLAQTGGMGGGLSVVATDASITGNGTSGSPLSITDYAGDAFTSVSYLGPSHELLFQQADGSTDRVTLPSSGDFVGLGGDTFITNEEFGFGDYAVVDSTLYIYYGRNAASFTPSSITGAANFSRIPVLGAGNVLLRTQLATGTPTTGYVPTATATGVAWMAQAGTGGTPLTNTQVEDETDTATTGTISPSVLAHSIDIHQAAFVRDSVTTTHTLTSPTYPLTILAADRPLKFTDGALVQFHAPTYTGFESSTAALRINVGGPGISDDTTANIRRLDGSGNHPWSDFVTGRHYLVVYLDGSFWPLDISLLTEGEVDDRIETLLADAVTGNTESGIDVTYDANTGKLNFAVHSGSGGATFRMGAGAPADSLGADDDTYLNTTAGIFYDKDSGTYTSRYTDQHGTGGGLSEAQVDARIDALALRQAQNLADLANVATARGNLGVLTQDEVDARARLRYTDTEKNKLAGIEDGATEDQTAPEIKTSYESNADTNAFTDALLAKLNGIMANADPADGVVDTMSLSVNGQVLTVTLGRSIGADLTQTVTLPSGGGGGTDDGVIDGLSMANNGTVTVTRTVGADITADFSTAINTLINNLALRQSMNLADLGNAGTARTNLGVLNQSEVDDRVRALSTDVSINDVLQQILAGANVTIDRGTSGQITVASTGQDGVANSLALAVNGQQLTVTIGRTGGLANLTQSVTLPAGGGGGGTDDGVITDISISNSGTVTITRSVGADITANFGTAINSLIESATNAALDSVAYNQTTRTMTFGTLGGGTSTISLSALNEFHGVDPTGAIDFERGDTVMLTDVLYFYTADVGATIQTSNIDTDNRFVQLALTDGITAAFVRGLLHLTSTETDHLVVGVTHNGRRITFDRNNAPDQHVDLATRSVVQLTDPDDTTWGFVNGEVFTGAVDALERTPVTYIVNTVGGDGNAITLSTGEEFSAHPPPGTGFIFRQSDTNTSTVQVTVDSAPQVAVLKANGLTNSSAGMAPGDMIAATLQHITWNGLSYSWATPRKGDASLFNVGTSEGEIAVIGPGDVLPDSVIPGRHASSHFIIPDSGVGGSPSAVTLSTGFNLTEVIDGATFYFRPSGTSTNNVTINVDGLGAHSVIRSDGSVNGTQGAQGRDLQPYAQVVWDGDTSPSTFHLQVGIAGTAVKANTGTTNGDLAFLGTGGRFAGSLMNSNAINGFSFSNDNNHLLAQRFGGGSSNIDFGSRYANLNGTTFTGLASGISPVDSANFVTLEYFEAHRGGGGVSTHDLYVGWSADTTPQESEFTANSDTHSLVIPNETGSLYFLIWRSDSDGGDPATVTISPNSHNQRNAFGDAIAFTLNGVAGQAIHTVTTVNALLYSGETVTVS